MMHDLGRIDGRRGHGRRDEPVRPTIAVSRARARSAIAESGERERDDDEDDQAHRGSIGWASGRWLERGALDELSSNPSTPSVRAAMARIAHRAAEGGDQAGRQQLFELVGRAAEARPDEERSAEQETEPEADPQDVAPGDDRQDGQGRQREPGCRRDGRARRRSPEPVAPVPDDGRGDGQEDVGRPADERPGRSGRGSRGWRPTGGSRPGPPPTRRAASPSGAASGSATNGAPTIVMTRPKIAVRAFRADPATTAPTTTASATPTRAGFTAARSLGGRRQLRVGGRREDPEHVERPVAQPRAADDLVVSRPVRTFANRPSWIGGRPSGTARRPG